MSQRLPIHVTVALVTLALAGSAGAVEVGADCKRVVDSTEMTLLPTTRPSSSTGATRRAA